MSEMCKQEAIDIIKAERECVYRQGRTGECCRDDMGCGACDLVQEDTDIMEAYDMAIEALKERPHENWEYLKEHITEMRDADGELNQKQTCQFILNLMGVIEKEGESEWSNMKYYVCCPMCDKEKCVRGTEECDAERWEKEREGETEVSELLECAKMLQEFCSKNEGCYPCMFRDKHGECRIGMPIDWELEELEEEGDRNE